MKYTLNPFVCQVGIQGFLKLSITVLGPDDQLPVHDLDEDLKSEQAREQENPNAEGTIQYARAQNLQFISLAIHKAQELLTTPSLILSSKVS